MYIKRILFLLLIIISCNVCYSAVISDNDGTTFLTKAEFDAMRYNFNTQIDEYNKSIDGKIDGTIAEYLAGKGTLDKPENLFAKFVNNTGEKPVWYKAIDAGSVSVPSFSSVATLTEKVRTCNNITPITFRGSSGDGYVMIGIFEDLSTFTTNWALKSIYYLRSGIREQLFSSMGWTKTEWDSTTYPPKYGTNYYSQQVNSNIDGSGKKWIYQVKNGRKCLKYFCPSYFVENALIYEGLYNMNFDIISNKNPYFNDNGKKTTSTLPTYMIEGIPGGTSTKGTRFTPTSATSDSAYVQLNSNIEKVTDGKNYLNSFFSIDSDIGIYAQDEEYNGTAPSSSDPTETVIIPDQQFYDVYYTTGAGKLQTNVVKGTQVEYKSVKIDNDITTNLSTFCNNASSNIAGESVYHGGGMPIAMTNDEGQNVRIGIKLSATSNVSCEIYISDKQFVLGSVPAGGSLLASGTIVTNAAGYTYFAFTVPNKGNVWLFLKNITDDTPVMIDDITV